MSGLYFVLGWIGGVWFILGLRLVNSLTALIFSTSGLSGGWGILSAVVTAPVSNKRISFCGSLFNLAKVFSGLLFATFIKQPSAHL